MLAVYNTILLPLRLFAPLWAVWAGLRPEAREECAERRLQRLPAPLPGSIWIHGSSVGEARIASALARGVRGRDPERPIAVSAHTRTGRAQLPAPPDVNTAFYLPLDFPGHASRLIEALRPSVLALIETELWPNLLHEIGRSELPAVVLNGRLAPERMARYRRLRALYEPMLQSLDGVGAQSAADAERFLELGVAPDRLRITGNVKYDLPLPAGSAEELRRCLGLEPDRPVFVAGSTGAGEEPGVLEAFVRARKGRSDLYLVIAPRHPPRVPEVATLLERSGLSYLRWSKLPDRPPAHDVLLVDTVGQLGQLYRLARVAFVGGSLVPVGGHNLLEPAAVGAPVLYGPHTHHVEEMAETLAAAGAGRRVADPGELGELLSGLLQDGESRRRMAEAAEAVLAANRGAMDRSLDLLFSSLEGRGRASEGES